MGVSSSESASGDDSNGDWGIELCGERVGEVDCGGDPDDVGVCKILGIEVKPEGIVAGDVGILAGASRNLRGLQETDLHRPSFNPSSHTAGIHQTYR